jgi:hypothetical protein
LPSTNHWYEEAGEELKETLPPAQNVVGPPEMAGAAGSGFTVTVLGEDGVVHPVGFETLTE